MKLQGKIFIDAKIEALTGIAIGGADSNVTIGGIDNSVIKNSEGVPFIPGSSMKGKLRSLLERKAGKVEVCSCGRCNICAIFGTGAKNQEPEVGPTRLYVRDAALDSEIKKMMENKEGIFSELELTYTEGKWENVIDRKTSKAQHPRQMERVPAGAKFDFNMVFNILSDDDIDRIQDLITGMRLLEDDCIGSSGSRGYGRIKFSDLKLSIKTLKEYETSNEAQIIFSGELSEINFENLKEKISEMIRG